MTGLLGELAVAAGLAAAVLGGAAVVTAREARQTQAVAQLHVARQGAEGLLAQLTVAPPPPGTHPVRLDGLPVAGALPDVHADAQVVEAGAGLRRVAVTLSWRGPRGPESLTLETVARVR